MYGDGAFESLRTYNGKPFLLKEHLNRLASALKILKIKVKLPEKKIANKIQRLMKAQRLRRAQSSRLKEAYIKIIVTRGESKGHGLSIEKVKGKPTLLIFIEKLNPVPKKCKAVIYPHPRAEWIGTKLKTLNYLEGIFARTYAESKGANEAIYLDQKGNVLEGTTSNVFIAKNNTLITPPKSAPILVGVTRNYIIRLAKILGIKVKEKLFKVKDLKNADEAFITSSGIGLVPIKKGAICEKIQAGYIRATNSFGKS